MIRPRTSSFVALAAVLMAALSLGQTTPPAAPPPTKLAVVNIVKLFEKLDEKLSGDRDVEKLKNDYTDKLKKLGEDLTARQKDLDDPKLFRPDSPQYKQLQDELLQKTMEYQAYDQFTKQKIVMELRVITADLYRKMNNAIESYSQANGIALVFVADDLNISNARTQQELQAMITVRKVVYYHPNFDITQSIIEKMNGEYKLGTGKKN